MLRVPASWGLQMVPSTVVAGDARFGLCLVFVNSHAFCRRWWHDDLGVVDLPCMTAYDTVPISSFEGLSLKRGFGCKLVHISQHQSLGVSPRAAGVEILVFSVTRDQHFPPRLA